MSIVRLTVSPLKNSETAVPAQKTSSCRDRETRTDTESQKTRIPRLRLTRRQSRTGRS